MSWTCHHIHSLKSLYISGLTGLDFGESLTLFSLQTTGFEKHVLISVKQDHETTSIFDLCLVAIGLDGGSLDLHGRMQPHLC